jgi:putative toxin-antitoxin system antitoxin component (TIGR02293 family)
VPNGKKGVSMATRQTSSLHQRTHKYRLTTDEPIPHVSEKVRESYRSLIDANGTYLVIALELLGGHKVFSHVPQNLLDVHHWVSHGIPSISISHLAHAIEPLSSQTLSEALGVSQRTLHRKKGSQNDTLTVAQGGRTFKFAEVVAKATLALGSREAAVQWLTSPAMGLDQQKPVDLIATPMGTQLVEELLGRIEYGVYA